MCLSLAFVDARRAGRFGVAFAYLQRPAYGQGLGRYTRFKMLGSLSTSENDLARGGWGTRSTGFLANRSHARREDFSRNSRLGVGKTSRETLACASGSVASGGRSSGRITVSINRDRGWVEGSLAALRIRGVVGAAEAIEEFHEIGLIDISVRNRRLGAVEAIAAGGIG